MEIEIVSHCVNYAKLLSFQMSSLVEHPPGEGVSVTYTLCYTEDDERTERTRRFFAGQEVERVRWNWMNLPWRRVNRRAIGRNEAALASSADWVWFTDVDYCFGAGCLERLAAEASPQRECLLFPKEIRATTREGGDALLAETPEEPALRRVPTERWVTQQTFRCAIGGVQITRGEVCRAKGYLRDSRRWQREADEWQGCREDPVFRKALGTQGCGIELPEVYRIRHNAKGRYDATVRL
jgi:hypothetical protein